MRCPECNQRNSVAAKKCSECDFEFPKRPIAIQVKVIVGFAVCFLFLWGVGLAIVPRLNDPSVALETSAKALANGTQSKAEDKEQLDKFDSAMRFYLKQSQALPSQELTRKLQSVLPGSLFEVNAFNLPHNIRLVEIDEGLHCFDYLLLKDTNNETKLVAVQGLDVFDNGTVISDPAGPALILVGHTAGTSGHRPQIKVFAMPAGELKDESERAVPKIEGDGKAALAPNNKDIVANISLISVAQLENLFDEKTVSSLPVPDETLRYTLVWKDGKYTLRTEQGSGALATLCRVAKWATRKITVPAFTALLNDDGKRAIEAMSPDGTGDGAFSLKKAGTEQAKKGPTKYAYVLTSPVKNVKVQLSRNANGWQVVGLNVQEGSVNIASATPTTEPAIKTDADAAQASTPSVEAAPKMEPAPTPAPITEVAPKSTEETSSNAKEEKPAETAGTTTSEKKPEEAVEVEAPTPSNPLTPTVLGKVRLRDGPSTDFKSVAELDANTPLEVIGKKDSWYKVKAGSKEGYVYGGLVDYKKPDAYTTALIKKDKPVKDSQNKAVATAKIGDRLVVLGGLENNKYKVQLSNGKVGFVDKDALDVKVDAPQLVP
jgi:uncharacterized protein YgiM (DUF1202 family)